MTNVVVDQLVRPHASSLAGDSGLRVDMAVCGVCMNDEYTILMYGEHDEHGTEHPRMLSARTPPSTQEAQEHAITPVPFRAWCPCCRMGKPNASQHTARPTDPDEFQYPAVAFDDCLMCENTVGTHVDDDSCTVCECDKLGRQRCTWRCYIAVAVPHKGVDRDDRAVRRRLRVLDFAGYNSLTMKPGQLPALDHF